MKVVIYIAGALLIAVAAASIWLLKPYMSYENIRLPGEPVTIDVQYLNLTGDPLCSKLYEVVNDKVSHNAVFPNVPKDIPDPHDVTALKDGDRLTIEGYRYQWVATNLITRSKTAKTTGMMDVVEWHGPQGMSFQSQLKNAPSKQFLRRNYTDCSP